ncbi:MAG: energy transducer TonB [Sulfitobacter sp.]
MHSGHYISGAGHLGLIGWLLLGGLFSPDPEPFEMTEVSVITGADFDAMVAAAQSPQSVTEVAQPAVPQPPADEAPELTSTPDDVIEQPAPLQTETPPEDPVPEIAEQALPPETPVEDTPPELPEPVGDVAVLVPEIAPEAAPRPIERVAPEPVAQPAPEAAPDTVEQEAVAPDAEGEAQEQEPQEATAPPEATTEIATEATAAPAASSRPPGRRPEAPARQVVQAEPVIETETSPPAADDTAAQVNNDDVLAALEAAQEPAAAPSGPPLSAGEKDALKVAVSRCWNIGSLSTEALGTIVVLGVQMNQNGTPIIESIKMLSATGGSDAAARRVFASARRALILCGANGYELPAEKYSQWQNVEITFDPSKVGY